MELFEASKSLENEPLAARMRPLNLSQYIGQEHIVGPGKLLRRAIQADLLSSIILYGPPGTGKTTLAKVIAGTTSSHFITINAVLAGVKEIRKTIEKAKELLALYDQKTILFVDEVHRWNKSQQDALLPWVENGTVILIGATIENPYFEVNRALVSRSRIFQLKSLTNENIKDIILQAINDKQRGYGNYNIIFDEAAMEHLVKMASGDARSALNALQLAVETTPEKFPPQEGEDIPITLAIVEESIQKKAVLYDKEGDYHYDSISAFIKALRGSDPDAALYWMAKMIAAGERPQFIFRRMLILASEDVGMADPQALVITQAAADAFDRVGMPEGRFFLSQACLYLSTCAKSNSAFAFFDALKTVEQEANQEVPNHLKDGSRDKKGFGHGEGYLYPHAYKDHWTAQNYMPKALQGRVFYRPDTTGYEAHIEENVNRRRELQLALALEEESQEVLSYSGNQKQRDRWINRALNQSSSGLMELRDDFFQHLPLSRHHTVLDLHGRNGFLLWEALRQVPEGGVYVLEANEEKRNLLNHFSRELGKLEKPMIIPLIIEDLLTQSGENWRTPMKFDRIMGHRIYLELKNPEKAAKNVKELLNDQGVFTLSEFIPSKTSPLSELIDTSSIAKEEMQDFKQAEAEIFSDPQNPKTQLTQKSLFTWLEQAGFQNVSIIEKNYTQKKWISESLVKLWFKSESEFNNYGSWLKKQIGPEAHEKWSQFFLQHMANKEVDWKQNVVFVKAMA